MKATNSNISIDLTEECNLACTYCFTWAKTHKKRVLPKELGYKIIDYWLANGYSLDGRPREISFWGGEPLLEWELLKDLVHYTNSNKGDQEVVFGGTTNGVLYTPDKVEWCKENNAMMLLSIDGIEEVHDACRKFKSGKGSWKIIDKNLRAALKIAPEQMVRSSITAASAPKFLDTVKYFVEDLRISSFSFSPVYEDDWNEESLAILEEQFQQTILYMIKKRKEGDLVAVKHFDDEANIPSDTSLLKVVNPCGAGNNYGGWSIDGVFFPCHRFNKHEKTFEERIKSPAALGYMDKEGNYIELNSSFRNEFLNFKDSPSKECQECDIFRKSVCNGGCYALNYDFNQDIHGIVEKQCAFNKIQRKAGIFYAETLEKENLPLPNRSSEADKSCICYNMCYMENSEFEIIHSDLSSDTACTCYNANYSQLPGRQTQTRTLKERRETNDAVINALKDVMDKTLPEKATEKVFEILKTLK